MTAAARVAMEWLSRQDTGAALAVLERPIDSEDHAALGMIHLAAGRWDPARSHLAQACALGDAQPVTLINLALAEDRLSPAGREQLRALARAHPFWDEPPLRLAESFRRAGEAEAAMAQYRRVLDLNPDRPEALVGLAVLLLGAGEPARAQPLLLRCCGLRPDDAEAWDALGIALSATGDAALAESAFGKAQALRPHSVSIALRRAGAAFAAGSQDGELARLEQALAADPVNPALLTARGVMLDRKGRAAEAAEALEIAAELAPDAPVVAAALAIALLHAGAFAAAIPALRRAVALAPQDPNLRNDLAAALNRVHRYREARELLQTLIAEHGEQPPFLCNLVNALVSLGEQAAGVALARRAALLAPAQSLPWRTLANALVYQDGTASAELTHATRQAAALLPRTLPPLPRGAMDPERKLRVGILSAALRTHPVGWLTVAGFEALDRAQFELVCFGQPPSEDSFQRRFQAAASGWHSVTRMSASEIAALVRRERIDVLIELGGWGEQGMLGVCAERAAPVQIKWVGMQSASTGVAEIDWMLTDRWETPDGCEPLYRERLLRLSDGYACYSPSPLAPDVAPLPALANGFITFGCFNNLAKITPETIACWAAILRAVPDSRLLLKAHQFNDKATAAALCRAFADHGVDPLRLILRGSSTHRGQLLQHLDVDVMLDPFPYSGGLTTCEALWMGVPVVTLPGQTFAARHSASHLCNTGLEQFVAADMADYQAIARRWAADPTGLAALRAGLRGQMRASPLCDARRFGASLGAALRHAWRQACAA